MQFHLLSFEGPDGYSRAGGIATRVAGLAGALAHLGLDTHLWFVGDIPRYQTRADVELYLGSLQNASYLIMGEDVMP